MPSIVARTLASWRERRRQATWERLREQQSQRPVHDFRDPTRGWGHDIGYRPLNGGNVLDAWGWCFGIAPDDYVLLTNKKNGETTRYRVLWIRYTENVRDMFFAHLEWASYQCYFCGEPSKWRFGHGETPDFCACGQHQQAGIQKWQLVNSGLEPAP
jgi:hypothetical protein